jgi:hypothetical protein
MRQWRQGAPVAAAIAAALMWSITLPYPIVIADRRNNRLIEIAPDKRIVWEFPSPNRRIYRGNDDVFFSPDGRRASAIRRTPFRPATARSS